MKQRPIAANPGQFLQRERWKQELPAEQVARKLGVQPDQLEALENWQTDQLPRGVYLSGLLERYARLLKESPAHLSKRFDDQLRALNHEPDKPFKPQVFRSTIFGDRLIMGAAAVFVVLLLTGYIAWQSLALGGQPRLVVLGPTNYSRTNQEIIQLRGQVDSDAQLYVNSALVSTAQDGAFVVPVGLQKGPNTIHLRVINPLGRSREETVQVLYASP